MLLNCAIKSNKIKKTNLTKRIKLFSITTCCGKTGSLLSKVFCFIWEKLHGSFKHFVSHFASVFKGKCPRSASITLKYLFFSHSSNTLTTYKLYAWLFFKGERKNPLTLHAMKWRSVCNQINKRRIMYLSPCKSGQCPKCIIEWESLLADTVRTLKTLNHV